MATRARLNNALRRLGSRWCLHIEALRASSQEYPASVFPDPVSDLIDDERRAAFEAQERHFESRCYLTFTFLPPEESVSTVESLLLENAPSGRGAAGMYRAALKDFLSTVGQIADILLAIMPEVHELNDDETLTYLHGCVSSLGGTPTDIVSQSAWKQVDAIRMDRGILFMTYATLRQPARGDKPSRPN